MTSTPLPEQGGFNERLDIPGYEGLYAITRDGRVWSYPKQQSPNGRWLSQGVHKIGYIYTRLGKNGIKKYYNVHRLVAMTYLPNPDGLPQVNHINGIKSDNKVENLEWCTAKQNSDHARENGLQPKFTVGTTSSKLTPEDVRDIRMFANAGIKYADIAKVYPVKRQTISNIANKVTWSALV